jgi:predicted porin
MNKKLLAVAVAGALSVPAVAFAQSSVTISGNLKMSMQNYKIGSYGGTFAARPASGNNNQNLVHDDSSRIIFNMTEDLGGGLQAIAQVDWRVTVDAGADAANGNNHVGFRSKQWGRLFFGRQDVHYFGRESDLTVKNDLQSDSISLLAYVGGAGATNFGAGPGIAIAGATRTTNIVHYTTPNWSGFSGIVAYSFNPTAPEADINSTMRKGYAWNVAPTYEARNFTIGYSYWSQKSDNTGFAANQRGDRLFGSYRWGGFRIGLAWDRSKVTNEGVPGPIFLATAGNQIAKRDTWSIPIEYSWGPHWVGGHYTRANDDKATTCERMIAAVCALGLNLERDGAKMWAIGYNYSLSKRTSVGVTYAQIKNDPGASYTPFTAAGGLGGGGPHAALPGEDPRFFSMTVRHAF